VRGNEHSHSNSQVFHPSPLIHAGAFESHNHKLLKLINMDFPVLN
jgi:hypothetical protein